MPGSLLQTKMTKEETDVHVGLDGSMVNFLAKLAPTTYQEYPLETQTGICLLQDERYHLWDFEGNLSVLVKLSSSLNQQGYVINPCNWCISNKNIHGKQCTIV